MGGCDGWEQRLNEAPVERGEVETVCVWGGGVGSPPDLSVRYGCDVP